MSAFLRHNPSLFHVTHRTAVEGIRRHGLLTAARLAASPEHDAAVTGNRATWTLVPDPSGDTAWLRWQNMPERPIGTRLHRDVPPSAWRLFINSMVFFFPTAEQAEGLRGSHRDSDREQVVLRFGTAALAEAGCALLVCRWNNGYLDRAPPERRRLRAFGDYRSVAAWRHPEPMGEITAWGGVPPGIPFEVLPGPR